MKFTRAARDRTERETEGMHRDEFDRWLSSRVYSDSKLSALADDDD